MQQTPTVEKPRMNSKSLSRNSNREIGGATVPGLADFPLGSLQSRAAVRSLLEKSVRKAAGEAYPARLVSQNCSPKSCTGIIRQHSFLW